MKKREEQLQNLFLTQFPFLILSFVSWSRCTWCVSGSIVSCSSSGDLVCSQGLLIVGKKKKEAAKRTCEEEAAKRKYERKHHFLKEEVKKTDGYLLFVFFLQDWRVARRIIGETTKSHSERWISLESVETHPPPPSALFVF